MKKIITSKYAPFLLVLVLFILSTIFIFTLHTKITPTNTAAAATGLTDPVLDKTIATLEAGITSNPSLINNYFDLSNAYLQKARETADSTYYEKIDALMNSAQKIEPNNADIPATRASVAMGRHHFVEAKQFALDAIAKNKDREAYFGLLGDADIELGQYADAVNAFQTMVNIRPGFASYSRIAYIRELYGDIPGAEQALNLAITSGSSFKENIAWAYVELGKLAMRNNLDQANIYFTQALQVLPTYTQAEEGLGKVAFAKGDTQGAIDHFTKALNGLPLTQYSTDLADVYTSIGDTTKHDQNIALSQAAYASSVASGVDTDLEESLFLSDHHIQLDQALAEAQRAYAVRPNIYAADYLGWAYYQNGDFVSAAKYSTEALRLGDFDPLILFHQGMIALKNNDSVHAKKYIGEAYALSPNFSIEYSGILKDTVNQLNK